MAKAKANTNAPEKSAVLTKAQIVDKVAEKTELTKKQVVSVFEAITELTYMNAKNGFTIPGIGKVVVVSRSARICRNPATGEEVKVPARKALKFRFAKAAKDAILPVKKK